MVSPSEKTPISAINPSSQENPFSSINPSSKENPPTNNFSFTVKPARNFILAIKALANSEFNELGLGRIDVHKYGFEITVRNSSNDIGHTWVTSTKTNIVKRFQCRKPLLGKLVQLSEIDRKFVSEDDENELTVYHLDGSDKLCFLLIPDTEMDPRRFFVDLLENDHKFDHFPRIEVVLEAGVPAEILNQIVRQLKYKPGQDTDLYSSVVCFSVSKDRVVDNVMTLKGSEIRHTVMLHETKPWTNPQASFAWKYTQMLESLDTSGCGCNCWVFFLKNPPHNIMLRFTFQDQGFLNFVKSALVFSPNTV